MQPMSATQPVKRSTCGVMPGSSAMMITAGPGAPPEDPSGRCPVLERRLLEVVEGEHREPAVRSRVTASRLSGSRRRRSQVASSTSISKPAAATSAR